MLTQLKMKQAVVAALEENDYAAIMKLAQQSRKVLSVLVRLAYDKTTLTGWRAIIAVGLISSVYIKSNYDFLRDTIRKLLWSLSDESGGIGWSAPEILGEIVSVDPKKLADIIPLIAEVYSVEEKVFRPGILYAFKRIAETDPESVSSFREIAVRGLSEGEPLARIYALELIRMLKKQFNPEELAHIKRLVNDLTEDKAEAWVYKNGGFIGLDVGELATDVHFYLKAI